MLLIAAEKLADAQRDLMRVIAVKRSASAEIMRLSSLRMNADQAREVDEMLVHLTRLNRYEDRAMARRRKAIKAFDAARLTQLTSRTFSQNEAKSYNENRGGS